MSKRKNYMEERIKKFDALCLNTDEQVKVAEFNAVELKALKDRKKSIGSFAWNGTMAMLGSPVAAVKTVNSAGKVNRADEAIRDAKSNLEQLRAVAQERYEKATGLCVNDVLNQMETESSFCK